MKRKGLARRAVAVGVALSMIFTLSACGKGEQDKSVSKSASNSEAVKTGEGKVLTVWIGKTFNPDADDRLAERFKSFAEVDDRVSEVKVETFPGSEGQVKWNAAIESGNVPDVSFLVAAPYANFSEMGLLEDLSDVIGDIEKNLGSLYPAVKKDMTTSDGSIYGVPLCNASTMLHYRTDLFEKAGIAAPPTSWEEMEEVCEKLSKVCDDGVSPFGHVISASDDSESHNLWILRSFG
ncbi:MAG TPA: extracellular solute-binding protein, partial [Candidatus Pelethocola excrementipullorum]|nr:extracellular solute-binding protein [Candidatus Pelethocola excrementipullorum]